jgi:hypothetical protein
VTLARAKGRVDLPVDGGVDPEKLRQLRHFAQWYWLVFGRIVLLAVYRIRRSRGSRGSLGEGGGDVAAGKAYVVGEKRPELFVPSSSGRIEPSVPSGEIVVRVSAAPELYAQIDARATNVVVKQAPGIVATSVRATERNLPAMVNKHQRRSG